MNYKCAIRKCCSSPAGIILGAWLASMLASMIFFPELFLRRTQSYIHQHDYQIPYENTFILASQFFHGTQLFDRYDQINYAYNHLTCGLYTLVNFVVAGIYVILSPFFKDPGAGFHAVYTYGYFGLCALIRTLGGYLLVRKFSKDPIAIWVSLFYLNTLLSVPYWLGILTNNLYAYFPLLMYLILELIERFSLSNFLALALAFTIAVANSPLLGLGYFYQPVHFFLLACLFWKVVWGRNKKESPIRELKKKTKLLPLLRLSIGGLLCVLIIAPSMLMYKSLSEDYYMAGSGIGETKGRMDGKWNPQRYFERLQHKMKGENYSEEVFNFSSNNWAYSWQFVGISAFVWAILGVILSADHRRHVFWIAFVLTFLWSTHFPHPKNWFSWVHWVNAYTNPFKFLLRSMHMPILLLACFLFPLIALGIEKCRKLFFDYSSANEGVGENHKSFSLGAGSARTLITQVFLLGSIIFAVQKFSHPVNFYVILVLLVFLSALLSFKNTNQQRAHPFLFKFSFSGFLVVLLCVEMLALVVYFSLDNYGKYPLAARTYQGLRPEVGEVFVDFQDPRVLPWRQYARFAEVELEPRMNTPQDYYGLFYKYTPLDRFFRLRNMYEPVPAAYKDWYQIEPVKEYFRRDKNLLTLVPSAFWGGAEALTEMLAQGFENSTVALDGNIDAVTNILSDFSALRAKMPTLNTPPALLQQSEFIFKWEEAEVLPRESYLEYRFKLPVSFPEYVASGIFTDDIDSLKLAVDGIPLRVAQGKLVAPFSFDVQNIKKGQLVISLPKDYRPVNSVLSLALSRPEFLRKVENNQHDQWGLEVEAKQDSWLVLKYPHSPKWKASVDGHPVTVYKANGYFLAVFIPQGVHQVLVQYWPDSPLRFLVGVANVLVLVVFVGLIYRGFRKSWAEEVSRAG